MGVTGKSCAQVFYDVSLHVINVYGMQSKAQFPEVYTDFVWEEGIPSVLHHDGTKEQTSNKVAGINRNMLVRDSYPEPNHPWQNPVKTRAIKRISASSKDLMDREAQR